MDHKDPTVWLKGPRQGALQKPRVCRIRMLMWSFGSLVLPSDSLLLALQPVPAKGLYYLLSFTDMVMILGRTLVPLFLILRVQKVKLLSR